MIANLVLNLGSEGEIPGVINQQGPWVLLPGWFCSRTGETFQQLVAKGDAYLICPNVPLPFPDDSIAVVYTNSVPVDKSTPWGPGVQSSEIKRILKSGSEWTRDGVLYYTKP